MDRTYGVLEIKRVDSGARQFSGLATTPVVDRGGDRIDPFGVRAHPRIPLFLYHDRTKPVGYAELGAPTAAGVPFTAWIPEVLEPGIVRDRTNEAWHSVKAGLATAVSIGWKAIAGGVQFLNGVRHLNAIDVWELSLETLPMNPHAAILAVKSLQAAPGSNPPGDTGSRSEGGRMTIAETIQDFEQKQAAHQDRLTAILETAAGNVLDQKTGAEYDRLADERAQFAQHVERLRVAESANVAAATRVDRGAILDVKTGAQARGGITVPRISVRPNVPQGQAFVRRAMAIIAGRGSKSDAIRIAEDRWPDMPEVALSLKAAIAPATTTDPSWAKPLVGMGDDFIALIRPQTVVGRIANLKNTDFDLPTPVQTVASVVNWVAEGKPKPLTKSGYSAVSLSRTKMAGIIIMTEELSRGTSNRAEQLFRDELIAGITQFKDQQFLDPAVAPVAGVHPGSITNGIAGVPATSDPVADLGALLGQFASFGISLSKVTLIMSESNAFNLGMFKTVAGEPMFATMGATGGSIGGIPVIASNTAGTNVIAVAGPYILYADDGPIDIDISREASVQMTDAPMDPADATTVFTSLWQNNLIGVRAELFANWARGLTQAVHYLTGATWTPSTP